MTDRTRPTQAPHRQRSLGRPLAFAEFALREFECDKEGNWIDKIPDDNDHSIDAEKAGQFRPNRV